MLLVNMNKDKTNDYLIMRLRTLAAERGATPLEIQVNVNRLNGIKDYPNLREQYIDNIK